MAFPGKNIDWEKMLPDWRAGILSKAQLSKEYGISQQAIIKHWRKEGIDRDLTQHIRAATMKKVLALDGTTEVEDDIIDANAKMQASIILEHRRGAMNGRRLVSQLFEEAELTTLQRAELEQLGELLRNPDENGNDRLNDIYRKVISLPGRVDAVKKLSEALRNMIALERQSFNIEDKRVLDPNSVNYVLNM